MVNATKTVSVLMPAYNHSRYIRQAIESFLMQEEIDAELLIGDDASTDNTLQIALEYANKYPDKIKVFPNDVNRGLIANYKRLIELSGAPYLAILESDDYWTDKRKLCTQVRYLEMHGNCGLVFTSGEFVDENGNHIGVKQEKEGLLERYREGQQKGENRLFRQVMLSNPVMAVTACFRRSAFEKGCNLDEFVQNRFITFDYPAWLGLATCSDFYAMPEVTSAYRVSGGSISNNASYEKRERFMSGIDDIVEYYINRVGAGDTLAVVLNERLAKHMILALAFNKFERYSYFCKRIDARLGLRWAVMRYLPFVFRFKKRKLVGTGTFSPLTVKKGANGR